MRLSVRRLVARRWPTALWTRSQRNLFKAQPPSQRQHWHAQSWQRHAIPSSFSSLSSSVGSMNAPEVEEQVGEKKGAGIDAESVVRFAEILGPRNVLTDPDDLEKYNTDWLHTFRGKASVVLRPGSAAEVARVLQHCDEHGIGVVPLGGNTGLVGGGVAQNASEIVLSLERMAKALAFSEESSIFTCEAGCILDDAEKYLNERGYTMPIDLAAKGSCTVGGNIATNAGGKRLVRYGNLHGRVIGLEVVLPDGQILNTLNDTMKDNTGLHLNGLFIGSEGILGVVTKIAIAAAPKPKNSHVGLFAVADYTSLEKLVRRAKAELGEVLAAVEYMDGVAFQASLDYTVAIQHGGDGSAATVSPFETKEWGMQDSSGAAPPFVFLVETAGSNEAHDAQKFEAFLQGAMEDGLILDGVLASNERQYDELWELREIAAAALSYDCHLYAHDVSLPMSQFDEYVRDVRNDLQKLVGDVPNLRVCGFGHLGDGNLHINVMVPEHTDELQEAAESAIYGNLRSLMAEGHSVSPSAEHGIGLQKRAKLGLKRDADHLSLIKKVKMVFDPNNIMNPGKVLAPTV